jgi:hypothetical protein
LKKQRIFAVNQPINRVSISSRGRNGQVAQSVEHRIENPGVAGSIPALSTQIAICVERKWLFLWHQDNQSMQRVLEKYSDQVGGRIVIVDGAVGWRI